MANHRTLHAILGTALVAASFANPVVNGGFETGDLSGWSSTNPPSVIADGALSTYSAFFAGPSDDRPTLSQTMNLAAGQYTLRFDLKNYGVGEDMLIVRFDGAVYLTEQPIVSPLESWAPYELTVSTAGGPTELRFTGYDALAGFQIDNVSLEPVPEPASILALGAGLLALRRRRSAK